MSLFKARDWWVSVVGEREEFDQHCLCVGDVDNSGNEYGKLQYSSFPSLVHATLHQLLMLCVPQSHQLKLPQVELGDMRILYYCKYPDVEYSTIPG